MRFSAVLMTAAIAFAGLSACNEKTATAPEVDNETQEMMADVEKIMSGENVTFGDIMGVVKSVGSEENQKKLACGGLSAGAGMTAMAAQAETMEGAINTGKGTLMAHLTDMAMEIAPTLEDTEVSTVAVQTAMKPVYAECMKYSMDVIKGAEPFKKGRYAKK